MFGKAELLSFCSTSETIAEAQNGKEIHRSVIPGHSWTKHDLKEKQGHFCVIVAPKM